VGKYVELPDAYKSINEAFIHAGAANECNVKVDSIQSEHLEESNLDAKLKSMMEFWLLQVLVTGELRVKF